MINSLKTPSGCRATVVTFALSCLSSEPTVSLPDMVDPLLSLAFSVHDNPGIYALLVGSGISRSAGIPTGYEVILELIHRIAALKKASIPRDELESWYLEQFGTDPTYGTLLEALARSQAERSRLLRSFFEPNDEEREEGKKVPTPAHHAIAELVAGGFVRIIVTTNFDRLLEQALEIHGIIPTVVGSADAMHGALPLAHSQCTVLKVHGDYLDARIRNTPAELASYPKELDRLLDQILDEYGLIVCGWSGDWDPALRAAIERAPNRRFTTYWAARGEPSEAASQLIQLRGAHRLTIEGADNFFRTLAENVASLAELAKPHPLSAAVAVQSLKRYLPDPLHRIRLHDLILDETGRVIHSISPEMMPLSGVQDVKAEIPRRVRQYEAVTGTLLEMLVAGVYHGHGGSDTLWAECLRRVGREALVVRNGNTALVHLRSYPALLLLYGGGLAAVAAGEYGTLATLLTGIRRPDVNLDYKEKPLILTLTTHDVIEKETGRLLREQPREYTPVSNHLNEALLETLKPYVGDQERYEAVFDRFEYLLSLVYTDEVKRWYAAMSGGPIGRFGWRRGEAIAMVDQEIQRDGAKWPPLTGGLFEGSLDRLKDAQAQLAARLDKLHWY